MNDYQKTAVYKWEDQYIVPKISKKIDFDKCQIIVDYIWSKLGYINPPKVHIDKSLKTRSLGGRYNIRLAEHMVNEHVLIHELAHSVNLIEPDDSFDIHGPKFVADYASLLIKFYNFDMLYLVHTLKLNKIDVDMGRLLNK